MKEHYTILIVEDEPINLKVLTKALEDEYFVLTANNGAEALDIITNSKFKISAIILDLIMPVMSGYEFLEIYNKNDKLKEIPVLVSSSEKEVGSETKCLELGANDFISKPYNVSVIKLRLLNAIERSQFRLLEQLKYAVDFDALTDIYNKEKLFKEVKGFLIKNISKEFVFMVYDVDNFKIYNSFFGVEEGDKLIQAMAKHLRLLMRNIPNSLYSRNGADAFNIVVENDKETINYIVIECVKFLSEYKPEYRIKPTFGIYIIDDINTGVAIMNDRAKMASKKCKGKFTSYFGYYDETLSGNMERAQVLINRMDNAMEEEQFVVYYQPKYDVRTNKPAGAEALCRWIDPVEGMISPGAFIPVFEQNGLISRLDFYMWEHVCMDIRKWLDMGIEVMPISVNVSRVNVYNPKLVNIFCMLTEQYSIPRQLFNIELTESAYTDNPEIMRRIMREFRENGFITLMDDFGSGYSSLNVLKDIPVDILKIDMKFMEDTDYPGRGECIVASVIRMAKQLGMSIVVEGVEGERQVNFLRGIGCEYIQGFYFARPMPVTEYESLMTIGKADKKFLGSEDGLSSKIAEKADIFIGKIIDNSQHPAAIVSMDMEKVECELISANEGYYDIFGFITANNNIIAAHTMSEEALKTVIQVINKAIDNKSCADCEYEQYNIYKNLVKLHMRVQYICEIDNKKIIMTSFENVSMSQEFESCVLVDR